MVVRNILKSLNLCTGFIVENYGNAINKTHPGIKHMTLG
jgi:hypothetical protein